MITTTMTYPEIRAELLKELPSVRMYVSRVLSDNKYRKVALKHQDGIRFKPLFYQSHHQNNYIILPYTISKSDFKKNGLCFVLLCYYFNDKNKIDVALLNGMTDYQFYSGHLIERYAERYLHRPNMNKMDAIMEYFKSNYQAFLIPFESSRYADSIIGTTNDGVIIGIHDGECSILKTFITFDMLKGEEIDDNNETSALLNELKMVCNTKEYIASLAYKNPHTNILSVA